MESQSLAENKEHIYFHFQNLDVLRIVSALIVMFAHGFEGLGWFGYPSFLASEADKHQPNAFGKIVQTLMSNFTIIATKR